MIAAGLSLEIASLRSAFLGGTTSATELAARVLARIAQSDDPAVWISRPGENTVRARACELDAAARADPSTVARLPLFGIPFAVKDNIDVAGMPTTAGCPAFAYTPAETAPVVAQLLAAGAMLLGKTNLDQFATGLVGTRSPYGAPLTGCGKSRDFEKMAMERARYRNEGHIRSMAYGRAPGDEWQRNDDQSTFSASC